MVDSDSGHECSSRMKLNGLIRSKKCIVPISCIFGRKVRQVSCHVENGRLRRYTKVRSRYYSVDRESSNRKSLYFTQYVTDDRSQTPLYVHFFWSRHTRGLRALVQDWTGEKEPNAIQSECLFVEWDRSSAPVGVLLEQRRRRPSRSRASRQSMDLQKNTK